MYRLQGRDCRRIKFSVDTSAGLMFVGRIVWAAFEDSKDYPWTEVGCVHSPGQLQQTSTVFRWVYTNIRMRMDVQMFVEYVYTTLASLFACMPCLPSGLQRAMNCSSSRFARCTKLVWWHAAANPLRLATACVLGSRHHTSCVMCRSANVAGCPPACTYSMRYFVHANSRHCVDKPGLYSLMSLVSSP